MLNSPNGNHVSRHAYGTRSQTTYVGASARQPTLFYAGVLAIVLGFCFGYVIGNQPIADARCQTLHSADTCALILR